MDGGQFRSPRGLLICGGGLQHVFINFIDFHMIIYQHEPVAGQNQNFWWGRKIFGVAITVKNRLFGQISSKSLAFHTFLVGQLPHFAQRVARRWHEQLQIYDVMYIEIQ